MKYGRILLLVIAVAIALLVGGGADVARSSPDTDISLDDVTILGADLDGDESTIEIPMTGNRLDLYSSYPSLRIVKEITITVTNPITVRVSGEFVPPNYTVWHCIAPFVAGTDALSDQGCTVGSPDPHYTVVGGTFRGLPLCQWNSTTENGTAPKVVMPWLFSPYFKCERFVDESTLVAVDPVFQAGGGAAGCRVNEVTPAAWAPAPVPNPYNVGDCILDWHKHYDVTGTGTIVLRVVDELELRPSESSMGKHEICEDFEVIPVGDTDPDTNDNTLTECFEVNIASPVGGLAALPDVAGSSGPNYALLSGLAAAALVALGAGGWYARRRWVR